MKIDRLEQTTQGNQRGPGTMGRHKKAQLAIVRRFHRVTLYLVAFRLVLDRILIININEKKKNLVLLQGPRFLGLAARRPGRRGCASYGPLNHAQKRVFYKKKEW